MIKKIKSYLANRRAEVPVGPTIDTRSEATRIYHELGLRNVEGLEEYRYRRHRLAYCRVSSLHCPILR